MEKIDLENWVLFSDRSNSKNYHSKDMKWLLKTSSDKVQFKLEDLLDEKETAATALSFGLPTPMVKDVAILRDGKYGRIYEYIKDKKSIARAISEDIDNIDFYMEKFVKLEDKIHSIKSDGIKYKSIEERIKEGLEGFDIYTDEEKKILYRYMDTIEKKDTFLHVDCQTGNVITSSKGEYAIDIGLLSYGNPIYDSAIYYLFSKMYVDEVKADKFFHVNVANSFKCWDAYVKYQYGITDDKKKKKLEEKLAPVAILTFTAHLPQIPCFEVHREVQKKFFKKYFVNV
ncbi:MAG: hypothetical protein MJ151_02515 [Lachnospiraceae bacterium]|nr:hypothetical protein [Lachnospiraceae bacterium]